MKPSGGCPKGVFPSDQCLSWTAKSLAVDTTSANNKKAPYCTLKLTACETLEESSLRNTAAASSTRRCPRATCVAAPCCYIEFQLWLLAKIVIFRDPKNIF